MDKAEFDRFADEYDALHAASVAVSGETPDYFARYKIDDVAGVMARLGRRPARILDFGGGVGNSLGPLRAHYPDSAITLLDPSPRCLEVAQRRHPDAEADFRDFDGRTIPFPDDTFDLVFTACVFHHIPPAAHVGLLKEIARVMAPGASLFLFEHNPFNPLTRKVVRDCPFDDNAILISPREMQDRLAEAGLPGGRLCYRLFFPRFVRMLRPLERWLTWLPLGAQYFIHATRA